MTITLLNMVVGRTKGTFKNGKIPIPSSHRKFPSQFNETYFLGAFFFLRHVQRSYVDTFIIFHIKTVFFLTSWRPSRKTFFFKSRTRELSLNQLSLFCIFVNQIFSNRKYLFKIFISDNLYNCASFFFYLKMSILKAKKSLIFVLFLRFLFRFNFILFLLILFPLFHSFFLFLSHFIYYKIFFFSILFLSSFSFRRYLFSFSFFFNLFTANY